MMKTSKKLGLAKQTIRSLSNDDLRGAAGGTVAYGNTRTKPGPAPTVTIYSDCRPFLPFLPKIL